MQHPNLFSVKKDHLLLTRSVKGRMRYYLLKIEETLFGEYLLEKVYGSMSHKKPTRVLKEYYDSWVEAKITFDGVIKGKKKKGYSCGSF